MTYTIPEIERENVQKLLSRFEKKAAGYGQKIVYSIGSPYAKERAVYALEDSDIGYGSSKVQKKVCTELVEVFDLTIESDIIRKEGYAIVAKIEHLDGGNIVTAFGCECKKKWTELRPFCDHCGCYRHQRITFIVRHENGEEKQVGRTCLKDYCGIDPNMILSFKQLTDILLDDDIERYNFDAHPVQYAQDTIEALALAIRLLKTQGYVKSDERGSNKEALVSMLKKHDHPSEAEIVEAEAMAEVIKSMDESTAFQHNLSNVRSLLNCGYCKFAHCGYVAYSPLAFARYLGSVEKEKEREAAKQAERKSCFIGEIGKRVTVDVAEMVLITSWENCFGYTYLYKFIDVAGNVLIWYASHTIETVKRIKATIKDHTEREGVKQTIVTRCSAA